jgi:GT2 family glycosyltransferase
MDRTISVIIVSYNTRQMTLECLRTLYANAGGAELEVFVVDNASNDDSAEAIRDAFPQAHVIRNEQNVGFGPANNQAIRLATTDYILLLNSDAFLRPHAIERLIAYLDVHPDAAIVGPRLLNRDESLQRSCYRFPTPWRMACEYLLLTAAFPNSRWVGDYRAWAHDTEREVDFVIGACMLVRRAAIQHAGLFDEDFFFYSEETDWCRRFKLAGWKICFTPVAEVQHLNGASGAAQADAVFNEFRRAQERFIRKHDGPVGLALVRIVVVIGAAIRIAAFFLLSAPKGKRAQRRATCRKWTRILTWTLGRRGPGLKKPVRQGEIVQHDSSSSAPISEPSQMNLVKRQPEPASVRSE